MSKTLFLFLLPALLPGCVTRNSVRNAPPDAGIPGTYAAPPEKVRKALQEALTEGGFRTEEDSPPEASPWRILASREPGRGSERIARVVGERAASDSVVRILVQSKSTPGAGEPSDAAMAQALHEALARKIALPAPAPPGSSEKTVDVGIEKDYRSPLPLCFETAVKICRERDYAVRGDGPQSDDRKSLSAQGKGFSLTMNFARTSGDRSRVVLLVRGRASPENRDEALHLLDKLREALLEPLD